jgi:hypothetical protein
MSRVLYFTAKARVKNGARRIRKNIKKFDDYLSHRLSDIFSIIIFNNSLELDQISKK